MEPIGIRDCYEIRVPTPYNSQITNCFLLRRDPVTLIECGALYAPGEAVLREGLREHGIEFGDLRRLLLTHAHPDHFGLARRLQETYGIEVFLHPDETAKAFDRDSVLEIGLRLLRRYGLPPQDAEAIRRHFLRPYVEFLQTFTPIGDGEELEFDGLRLRPILTPGHALGHLSWYEPESETLFCGDALLADATPYPALEPDDRFPNGRAPALRQFTYTLDTLQALSVRLACPSHGRRIDDLPAAVRNARAHNERQIARIAAQLQRTPDADVFALASAAFPHQHKPERSYLAICTAVAVLDLLGCPLDPALRGPL